MNYLKNTKEAVIEWLEGLDPSDEVDLDEIADNVLENPSDYDVELEDDDDE